MRKMFYFCCVEYMYIIVMSATSSLQNFVVKADDLEEIAELGRGAYGVVHQMKHVPSGVIMAVKVGRYSGYLVWPLCRRTKLLK